MTKASRIMQEQDARGANTKDIVTDRITRGEAFTATAENKTVAQDGTLGLLLVPSSTLIIPKLVLGGSVGGDADVAFYENPTVTANGTPLTRINRNRRDKSDPLTEAYSDPTVSDPGFLLFGTFVPGGEGRQQSPGAAAVLPLHWQLDENLSYYVVFTNRATVDQPLLIQADWVEEPKAGP